jgi:hypothetical protein
MDGYGRFSFCAVGRVWHPTCTCEGEGKRRFRVSGDTLAPGSRVAFRLSAAYCPEPGEILDEATPDVEVIGEVVLISDSGHDANHFAVVQAPGIRRPIVVPTDRLKSVVQGAGIRTIIW